MRQSEAEIHEHMATVMLGSSTRVGRPSEMRTPRAGARRGRERRGEEREGAEAAREEATIMRGRT